MLWFAPGHASSDLERRLNIHVDRLRWNRKYSAPGFEADWAPDVLLAERLKDLPPGRALDVACGIGANALFLAKRGYRVDAIDLSDVAIERLRMAASSEGVSDNVHLVLADVEAHPFEVDTYDLVVCFRFLSRTTVAKMHTALKPGGVLLYQTFTTNLWRLRPERSEDHLLEPGELPALFSDLVELYFHEDSETGVATFIGRKA